MRVYVYGLLVYFIQLFTESCFFCNDKKNLDGYRVRRIFFDQVYDVISCKIAYNYKLLLWECIELSQDNPSLFLVRILSLCHVLLITISNILVQFPFEVFGYHTTWGAFTYPVIFIITDLTTRIFNANAARNIIFYSMIPGLVMSYIIASYVGTGDEQVSGGLFVIHPMPLRIAFACFIAYTVSQLLDIFVFQKLRNHMSWCFAPAISSTVANLIDTILFFSVAFYHCSNSFLSQHWLEIAMVDMFFKVTISLIAFVPIYGMLLNVFYYFYSKKKMA
ncbi:MAG: 7-cyano-7-deazaguanine/7-aminomethyl-7-deazaguanine transporter [Gammaproteobacteria bacterium]|nr:7-cyano-7-deazaguanine/7-aminomethyl-7-deazaguanine transporter [Gammaproteobacteria bacterium]